MHRLPVRNALPAQGGAQSSKGPDCRPCSCSSTTMLPSTRSISQGKMLQFAARRPIVPARGLSSCASMHFFREAASPAADQASIVDRIEKLMTEMKGLPKQGMTNVQQQEFEELQRVVQGTDPQEVKAKGAEIVRLVHLADATADSAATMQAAPTEPAEQANALPNQADSKPVQPAAAPAKPFDWQAHLAMQGGTVNPSVAHQVHWPTSTAKAAQAVPPFVNMLGPKQRKSLEIARRDIALKEWFHRAAKLHVDPVRRRMPTGRVPRLGGPGRPHAQVVACHPSRWRLREMLHGVRAWPSHGQGVCPN
jgi:hypothetical protein